MASLRVRSLALFTLAVMLSAAGGSLRAETAPAQSPSTQEQTLPAQPEATDPQNTLPVQPADPAVQNAGAEEPAVQDPSVQDPAVPGQESDPAAVDPCKAEAQPESDATQNYSDQAFVQIVLGQTNQELGVRLLCQPDGLTRPYDKGLGQVAQPNKLGIERYFYFDIHPSYIQGGKNHVVMTISYRDIGLTPVYLEYDSFDPYRPESKADAVVKKRLLLATRTNSDATRTARIVLDDARFGGNIPGGADFRVVSTDELIVTAVSVMLTEREKVLPLPRVILYGQEVQFNPDEVQPYIVPATGTTLVPFRAMFNALGVPDTAINWDGKTRTIEVQWAGKTIGLTIDSKIAKVNGQEYELLQEATILGDRTVIPLRFVMEQFGLKIDWDGVNRVINLSAKNPSTQLPPVTEPGTTQPGTEPGTTQPQP